MNFPPFLLLLPGLAAAAAPALQPDPRGAAWPDRRFDLLHLQLDLEISPEEEAVKGTATWEFRRLAPGPLLLQQEGLQISAVEIDGVQAAKGTAWGMEPGSLWIEIPGDAGSVAIHYEARPRLGLHFRHPGAGSPDKMVEAWSQGEGEDNHHWFPCWEDPSDRFIYEGHITAPDGYRVITNSGVDLVSYLVMVAVGPYEEVFAAGDPTVVAYVPPGTAASATARVNGPVPAMKAWYAARTGVDYPWPVYRQTFVQRFIYSGMENSSSTVETDRMLISERVAETRGDWVEAVVAHELAHQWFGDLLTSHGWRELWLNEGFATFMGGDWRAHDRGVPISWAASVRGWYQGSQDGAPLAGRFHQGAGAPQNHNVYAKGASALAMLRVMLGEEAFWAGIQRYTGGHRFALVETRDLRAAMEEVSGQELGWFFQQWVELGQIPKLHVEQHYEAGQLTVTVAQDLSEGRATYTLPVEVEIGRAEGEPIRRRGWLTGEDVELQIELPARPAYVAFDPQGGILAAVEQEQAPEAWEAQARRAAPYARLVAITALGETDAAGTLTELLLAPASPIELSSAAATSLGAQGAQEPLLVALDSKDARLRRAAATALGQVSAEVGGALRRQFERESNPDVQAALLRALASHDPLAAVLLARRNLMPRDSGDRERSEAALEILGAHGDPADLGSLLEPRLPDRLRNDGLRGAARLLARQEGPRRKQLAERIERAARGMLTDLDLRTRQSAVAILGEVGSLSSIPFLEELRRREPKEVLGAPAMAAITAIRARRDAPPSTPNLTNARIEALEERLEALEAREKEWMDRG